MKLTIGNPKCQTNPRNIYKFESDFMYGDADGNTTVITLVPKNAPNLINFVEYLESLDEDSRDLKSYETETICLSIPREVSYEEFTARFCGYSVTFFDALGLEHEVKIEQ